MPHAAPQPPQPPRQPARLDELLLKVGVRDPDAWTEFYGLTRSMLVNVAMASLHNRAMAEEVAHDVLVSLWVQPFTFDPARGSANNYLRIAARRRAIDQVRANARSQIRDSRDERESAPLMNISVDDQVGLWLQAKRVRAAIRTLPELQRVPIVLSYYLGMTHTEIAATTRTPLGTVKSRIRSGLHTLQTSLA